MAITGLGMDAVELSRIEKIVAEPKTFLQKVLTPAELEKYNSLPTKRKVEFLAGRFGPRKPTQKHWERELDNMCLSKTSKS